MRSFLEGILKKIEARAAARLEAAAHAEVAAARKAKGVDPQSVTAAVREDSFADALIERGNQYEDEGNVEGALRVYRQAAEHSPQYARVHLNIGNALRALQRFDESRAAYERARELDPDDERALLNLGNLFMDQRDFAAAESAYRDATRLKPDWSAAWLGLGCALEESDADAAAQAYREAARLDAADAHALMNLAALQRNLGDAEAAVDAFRAALAVRPDDLALHSDLLLTMNLLPEISGEALLEAHRRYGERLEGGRPEGRRATEGRATTSSDRKLRVGFVSGDFRAHPVSFFITPLWRNLDRTRFAIHAYSTAADADAITEGLRSLTYAWRDVADLDDDALEKQIADDRIDVLVDLSGHTSRNRLAVFARRPAPLQLTWLGYLGTTGLASIDRRICDRFTDPAGVAERWQSETPARLPNSQWCYEPQIEVPAPSALPRASRGFWTFGSFNQSMKLGPQVLQSWIEVLNAFADSRLRVVGVTVEPMRQKILRTLGAAGIDARRIELSPRLSIEDYFAAYRDVDVALDSFPYNGGTTTCDALIMGVPVAVVEGARSIARGGVSLLSNVGLSDWIARTPAELPHLLLRQLGDVDRIARLRAELPDRMRASPLMDAPRFARDFEALLRDAWTSH